MQTVESVLELIGRTPMLRLGGLEPSGGAEIWAKMEFLNPGGSIKDRIGMALVRAAEATGTLAPGGTIVEATAGNTGIALAMAGVRCGYRVVIVVPAGYAMEKQRIISALGAELVVSDGPAGMSGAQKRAAELAATIPGSVYVDQFANPANPAAHHDSTGPEIWEQTGGRLDAIVLGCGSGGTFSGVARFLKEKNPAILTVAVEPQGSILGGGPAGPHLAEGIGMTEIPDVMDTAIADEIMMIEDPEAFATVRRLAAVCGVLGGSSAGANVAAAIRIASRLGAGKRVVTAIPDSAERYMSKKIFDAFAETP